MNEINRPAERTYLVIRDRLGAAFAVTVEPSMCLHLGAGATILWQGTDSIEWEGQKRAAGIVDVVAAADTPAEE